MKKMIALILTVVLVVGNCMVVYGVTGLPVNYDVKTGEDSLTKNVTASYTESDTTIVYQLDLYWGDLKFKYTEDTKNNWNSTTHQYESITQGGWKAVTPGSSDVIRLVNHSNHEVRISGIYNTVTGFENIVGSFAYSDNTINSYVTLPTAEDTDPNDAPEGTITLSLGNTPSKFIGETTIGTVTVTADN